MIQNIFLTNHLYIKILLFLQKKFNQFFSFKCVSLVLNDQAISVSDFASIMQCCASLIVLMINLNIILLQQIADN